MELKMKNRTTVQIPKEVRDILKKKKLYPREPYGDMMTRTLKENEDLKKKLKELIK